MPPLAFSPLRDADATPCYASAFVAAAMLSFSRFIIFHIQRFAFAMPISLLTLAPRRSCCFRCPSPLLAFRCYYFLVITPFRRHFAAMLLCSFLLHCHAITLRHRMLLLPPLPRCCRAFRERFLRLCCHADDYAAMLTPQCFTPFCYAGCHGFTQFLAPLLRFFFRHAAATTPFHATPPLFCCPL